AAAAGGSGERAHSRSGNTKERLGARGGARTLAPGESARRGRSLESHRLSLRALDGALAENLESGAGRAVGRGPEPNRSLARSLFAGARARPHAAGISRGGASGLAGTRTVDRSGQPGSLRALGVLRTPHVSMDRRGGVLFGRRSRGARTVGSRRLWRGRRGLRGGGPALGRRTFLAAWKHRSSRPPVERRDGLWPSRPHRRSPGRPGCSRDTARGRRRDRLGDLAGSPLGVLAATWKRMDANQSSLRHARPSVGAIALARTDESDLGARTPRPDS